MVGGFKDWVGWREVMGVVFHCSRVKLLVRFYGLHVDCVYITGCGYILLCLSCRGYPLVVFWV
jgi:hypothetical protein